MENDIIARLERIEQLTLLAAKTVLTIEEVAELTGLKKSYLYNLTHAKKIPHYRPNGGIIYFDRHEVEAWMKRNRINTVDEAASLAAAYCAKKGDAVAV